MKILSNFDTEFREKLVQEKNQEFGSEKTLLIIRSKYYLIFRVLFPGVILSFILLSMLLFLEYIKAFPFIFGTLIFVWFLVFWFRVFRKYLKYKYDFTLVTPRGVITYKQKGILQNQLKEIPSRRIKAIQISRTGILGNIFGFWEIDIIADMSNNTNMGEEDEAPWVTGLTYVDHPFQTKTQITKLCFD